MAISQRVTEAISAKLPKVWVGYFIAAIFIIAEIVEVIVNPPSAEQEVSIILRVIAWGGWVYWFICVYKMHKVLAELTNSAYPITAAAAVGYHFIPLYNVYWLFKWPAEIAKFINARLERRIASKDIGVFLFLVPFVGRYMDGGIALMVVFSVGHYLSRKILQVIQESNRVARQEVGEEADKFHEETKPNRVVITCPNQLCQQKLSVKKMKDTIEFVCPTCNTIFHYRYNFKKEVPEVEEKIITDKAGYKVMDSNGEEYGPVDLDTLRQWVGEYRVRKDNLIFHPEYNDWILASEVPQLSDLFVEQTLEEETEEAGEAKEKFQEAFKEKTRWYYQRWFVVASLIFLTPIGIILLWGSNRFRTPIKIGLTIVFVLYMFQFWRVSEKAPHHVPIPELMMKETRSPILLPRHINRALLKSVHKHVSKKQQRDLLTIPQIVEAGRKAMVLIEKMDKYGELLGQGSGFIIHETGVIATNYHVVEGAHSARVKLANGNIYDRVSLVAEDSSGSDLAILKIEARNLPAVSLGDSEKVKLGEHVIAIGSPLGYEGSISDGLIGNIQYEKGTQFFQITTPISWGSSGGALFNMYGEVIGITTSTDIWGQNLNFAIPINYLKSLIEKTVETIPRAYTSLPTGTRIGSSYTHRGSGELKIDNGTNLDAVVKLVNISTNQSIYSVYIKSKDIYRIKNIPNGAYKLLFGLGKDWDGENKKFLQFQTFSKFRDNFNFVTEETSSYKGKYEEIITKYCVFEITLHSTVGGTAKTQNIPETEFDMY